MKGHPTKFIATRISPELATEFKAFCKRIGISKQRGYAAAVRMLMDAKEKERNRVIESVEPGDE